MIVLDNLTIHCWLERNNRIDLINSTIGFGEKIIKKQVHQGYRTTSINCLTDSGVVLCKDVQEKKILTLFIASPQRVLKMYNGNPPKWIYKKAIENLKYST